MVAKKKETKIKKASASKMTLDKLALMVARGFEQVDNRFVRVELDSKVIRNNFVDVEQNLSYLKLELKDTRSEIMGDLVGIKESVKGLASSNKQDIDKLFSEVAKIKQKVGLK